MSCNAIGTILRILTIAIGLMVIWFLPVYFSVLVLNLIFDINIGFGVSVFFFCVVMLYRMFFPKNVFL